MAKFENDKEFLEHEEQFDRLFDGVASLRLKPSASFKDKVLQATRMKSAKTASPSFFKMAAVSALAFVFGIAGATYLVSRGAFVAAVSQQVAINLDLGSHVKGTQCSVRVELPNGVHFFSKANPEIAQNSSLELPCATQGGALASNFPIVLQGSEEGLKRVSVHFLDGSQQEVSKSVYKIRFKKAETA